MDAEIGKATPMRLQGDMKYAFVDPITQLQEKDKFDVVPGI